MNSQLAALADLPVFTHHSIVIDPGTLRYNPTNDIIFPSVIETTRLKNPIARYYLYFAPHDQPGGICLVTADKLEGPWVEYPDNPLIKKDWPPHYGVSHVSSPDAIWNEEESKLFLYFHGENNTTRFATSIDGLHFEYGGVAVDTSMFDDITESSYARVQRHTIAGKNNRFILMMMGNNAGIRRNYLAWSADGRKWETLRRPFIDPPPGCNQAGSPIYFEWKGKQYVIYHANLIESPTYQPISNLYVEEVDERFEHTRHVGKLLDHTSISADNQRQSDPYLIAAEGKLYLFTAVDGRLKQKIALAIADAD